ncbi:hypothetical protein pdam_00022644 [Pocillopora damicornis]|uniref:Uncharacterized protein n=1 Tax=Pocillopora damicornis TaxID=46731 RepID=A0A3M6U9G4_POCDA|nr:hypothetical protein pdam_00022644 [Pocillopora damicornis]
MGRLESGKTSVKENEGKRSSKPSDPSSKDDILKTLDQTSTGLLSKLPSLKKQAGKEKASTLQKFNPKWIEEFPWL